MLATRFGKCLLLTLTFIVLATAVMAAPSPEQRIKVKGIENGVRKADSLYKAKKNDEAAEALKQAQTLLEELIKGDTKEIGTLLPPLRSRMSKTHDLLELEGIKLPAVPVLPLMATGARPSKGGPPTKGGKGTVSFTKQIAPLLANKCGGCHVRGSKGDFNMDGYAKLMKGSAAGVVLFPGNSKGSPMVELITEGKMPPNGNKVAPLELAMISKWIDEGAKFDGANPNAPLGGGAAPATPTPEPARPKLALTQASPKDEVQFGRDIGPVIVANCLGCHGNQNPRGQLGLDTFARLQNGGVSGLAITPGNGRASLIVKKLRGEVGARMPMGKPPLSDEIIAKFDKWITSGAKFDGPDPAQPVEEVVAIIRAQNSSHEELTKLHDESAQKNWRLTLPDAPANKLESKNFLFMGNVNQSAMNDVGQVAEEILPKLEKLLRVPAGEPLVKGRMTIYVFDKRYDYGEVGTMVEKREIPHESKGHWRYTVVDAYGCIVPAKNGEYGLPALLAEQIAGVYVASYARVPHWFAAGSARTIASKVDPKDARVRKWDDQVPGILATGGKPDSFLMGGGGGEESDVLSYSFVKYLMTNDKRYRTVLSAVHGGTPFDQAFQKAFGGTPNQLAATWASKAASKRR